MNLKSSIIPTWCPGCNDYLLFAGIEAAVSKLGIVKENLVIVYDIGCIGNMADFFKTYAIHGLHGRCIPTAIGVKMSNPKLTVIAVGGDGGVYGEGLNHLITAARSDANIAVFVSNNQLYSLTTGQTSPTTPQGAKTKSTPQGYSLIPVDPVNLVKSANPRASAVSVDGRNLNELSTAFSAAISRPGFSLVDVRQICATFGKQLQS